jgi:hypothetical protein
MDLDLPMDTDEAVFVGDGDDDPLATPDQVWWRPIFTEFILKLLSIALVLLFVWQWRGSGHL